MYQISASKVVWSKNKSKLPESNSSFSKGGQNKMVAMATVLSFDRFKSIQIIAYR